MKNEICIIVPVYNEELNLHELIKRIYEKLNSSHYKNNYNVIIVNDCSKDNTIKVFNEKILNEYKNIKLINLKFNIGKAYAIDIAIHKTDSEKIVIIDGDLQYDADDIPKILDELKNEVVLVNGKRSIRSDKKHIVNLSNFYCKFLSKLLNVEKHDFFSGIKAFKKKIYFNMDFRGMVRFLIFYCLLYKLPIKELTINHSEREFGKTAYSLVDRFFLSLADMISIFNCVYLNNSSRYKISQYFNILFILFLVIETIYIFFTFKITTNIIFLNILIITSFVLIKKILKSFFNFKSKDNFDPNYYISSIIQKNNENFNIKP